MLWMNMNMGPRGRRFGHRGFSPWIFMRMLGVIIGCTVTLSVFAAFLVFVVCSLSALFPIVGSFIASLFSGGFFTRSFMAGLAIGLIWSMKNRKDRSVAAAEEKEDKNSAYTGSGAEEEVFAARSFRNG